MTLSEARKRVSYWVYQAMVNSSDWLESIQNQDDVHTEADEDRVEQAWEELKAELLRRGGDPKLKTL